MKLKNAVAIGSMMCFSLFTLTGCIGKPFMGAMQAGGGLPVTAQTVSLSSISQSGIYQSTLISRYSVSIQPQVSGQVAEILVNAGDAVKAGQLLMVIDKRKQEAALNSTSADSLALKSSISQAKNMLSSLQIQRKALESNLELNKNMYDRYSKLYDKKSVSKQDLERYTDAYNKAKSDLDANTAQIDAQKAAIEGAKSNYQKSLAQIKEQEVELQYYKITAPYSGVIGDIPVKKGNHVTASTELLSITQNNSLEINTGLPVEKVFDIQKGLPVEVLNNIGEVINTAKISFVSPKVDTSSQTILVKALLQNPKGILKADQSVKTRIIFNKSKGILVPTGAISHLGGQDFAFLVLKKGNQTFVKQVAVKLGEIQDNKYVVIDGLKAGDMIVTEGIQKLSDNMPVMVMGKGV